MRRRLTTFLALGAVVVGALVGAPGGADADTMHRAAVIVEGDGQVRRIVVEFPEESITGLELLRRAGAEPVVYSYSGIGGAVCRLFGVGRDAGPDCLGGTNGDARYWAYFRATAGATAFRYAAVGGGAATVRDGDVEGWRFGTGAAPAYASIDTILGITPPPTAPPTATGDSTPAPVPDAPDGASVPGPAPDVPGVAGAAPAPGDPGATGSTGESGGVVTGPALSARPAVARRAAPDRDDPGGPRSLVFLALGLGGIGGWILWTRRSRREAGTR